MKKFLALIVEFFKSIFSSKVDNNDISTSSDVSTESGNTEENNASANTIIEEKHYKDMVILLDNGHASTTPGKRSPILPDGSQFFEYEFNRDIVKRVAAGLEECGIEYRILVPEVNVDIKLATRAARANAYCAEYGVSNCLLVSVHANAGSNGQWQNGRGWSVYTTKGETKSDEYATIFFEEAEKLLPEYGMTLRSDKTDGDPDYEENFTILYCAKCPALLTENLFMDNKKDVAFLMSEEGRDVIAQIHLNAIKRILAN